MYTQTFNLRSVPITNNESVFYLNTFYNHAHNILRLLDILPNAPFTTSEMKVNRTFAVGRYFTHTHTHTHTHTNKKQKN